MNLRLRVMVIAGALLLGGCSVAAPPISPAGGVDELVIPTPSPAAADFSSIVDNPWFPLVPGAAWRYRSLGDPAGTQASVSADVVEGVEIDGVATTGLRTTRLGERGVTTSTIDYYAQDEAGNVWWFGREGEWRAGEDAAQAGLIMAARPRRGDGYAQALAPQVAEPRAEVLRTGLEFTTTLTTYAEVVAIESLDELGGPGVVSYYARGVGMIRSESSTTIELEEFAPGS